MPKVTKTQTRELFTPHLHGCKVCGAKVERQYGGRLKLPEHDLEDPRFTHPYAPPTPTQDAIRAAFGEDQVQVGNLYTEESDIDRTKIYSTNAGWHFHHPAGFDIEARHSGGDQFRAGQWAGLVFSCWVTGRRISRQVVLTAQGIDLGKARRLAEEMTALLQADQERTSRQRDTEQVQLDMLQQVREALGRFEDAYRLGITPFHAMYFGADRRQQPAGTIGLTVERLTVEQALQVVRLVKSMKSS